MIEYKGHCIICHQDNVTLSDEHVIPKAIGGCYHVFNVCEECNGKILGAKVDPLLVDHPVIQLIRWQKKLKGQNSSYPKPFAKPSPDDKGNGFYATESADGTLQPHIQTSTKCKYGDNGKLESVSVTLDVDKAGEAPQILEKILKKNGISSDEFTISEKTTHHEENPVLTYNWMMPLKDFNLDLLKIAYEFTCDCLPEYEKTERAKLYSEILHDANPERLDEVEYSNNKMDEFVEKVFDDYIDFSSEDRHYLFLLHTESKLICIVRLFNIFSTGFVMDIGAYHNFEASTILINDVKLHTCEKYKLEELVKKVSSDCEISLVYDRKQYKGALNLKKISCDTASCYKDNRNNTILFDGNRFPIGTIAQFIQKLDEVHKKDSVYSGAHITHYYMLKDVFVYRTDIDEFLPLAEITSKSYITKL